MADNKEMDDKEYYSATIKSLVPINELSPQLQNEVINICNILKFKKKEFVFKQGDRDDYSFYLLETIIISIVIILLSFLDITMFSQYL